MSEQAVEYAKTFGKSFTYSEDDIKDLEEILDFYSKDLKGNLLKNLLRKMTKTMPTENQIYSMSLIWGSYLGQLLKKYVNPKLCWVEEEVFGDGKIIHLKDEEVRFFPIDKVYKRIMNGSEDNIISFYEVLKRDF
ncbi:hypothetical protein ACFFF5_14540 [Lederbergia wuyishanensis]|uniref:DUF3806 domain-containing protein n=1 Tax=Lederbergia wuyishanensis TaxID=1347903 RepID=A0ABU0D9Y7_9BACI|nr:hypothetical protein [Lederbergia wuyishanensis]MCJ8007416.1 hypothetical protein [Lederbergia wuyishanensis]MDQ0345146.1 hypothetical protein [Lederbergia wuyishanensis]